MKKHWTLIAAALALLAAAGWTWPRLTLPQVQVSAEQVVANVQAFYDAVDDFHADFTQAFTNVTLGETDTSTGHVYFDQPGRMRWDYATPRQKYIISNGETLWIWEPEPEPQYYVQPLTDSDLPTAIRFLMGQGRFTEEFTITLGAAPVPGTEVLEMVPREPNSHYTQIRFVVDAATWQVRETVITDPLGNTNHLTFANVEVNVGIPDSGFEFTPPEGARQIEAP